MSNPEFRVATFNIRHGAQSTGRVSLRRLARACRDLDADVLGLQEVDRGRVRSWLRDESVFVAKRSGACSTFASAVRRGPIGHYGNALLVRGEIDGVAVHDLPGTGTRERRVAILAHVRVQGVAISVAVTHLQHRPARRPDLADEAPAQLDAVLALLSRLPRPRVLLGDLNLQPPRAEPVLEAAGYRVASAGATFPSDAPRVCLDYVAVDGIDLVEARIGPRAGVSDHRALIAELRVTELSTGESLP